MLLLASGTGRWLLGQQPRPAAEQVTPATPVAAAARLEAWLRENDSRPPLRVFASMTWSDYLLWELPPAARVYWYSHWHCYTPRHMVDGNRLLTMSDPPDGWRIVLDRCRFNALALPAYLPEPLYQYLLAEKDRPGSEWTVLDDETSAAAGRPSGIVAVRRTDPFVQTLLEAQAAQACVGGTGMAPMAGQWTFLTHLPWCWPDRR